MALDPNVPAPSPWVVPEWDDYITGYQGPVQIAPLPPQQLAVPAMPVQEEISVAAEPQALPPAEESQIEIHQPPPAQLEALMPPDEGVLTPPLLGQVDAVSGPTGIVPREETLESVPVAGQAPGMAAGLPDEYLTGEELGAAMSRRSAEEQAEFSGKIDRERAQFVADRAREEANITRRAQEDNALAYEDSVRAARQRTAELDAEAKQLADTDPLDSISGGQKILGVLASIIGGFTMAKTGRNVGLEAVNRIADQAAQQHAQKIQLNQRQRQAAGEQVGAAHDLFKSQEVVRLAVYDSAIKKLESEAQGFDPHGTTAQRIMTEANQLRAARADALAKYNAEEQKRQQQQFENDIKYGELGVKVGELDLKKKAQAAKLAGGGGGAKQKPEYWEAYSGGKRPPHDMTQKEFGAWLDTQKDVKTLNKGPNDKSDAQLRKEEAEATEAEAKAAAAKGGYFIRHPETGAPMLGKDGEPMPVMDGEKRKKIDGIVGAAKNIRVLADRMKALKEKYGGNFESLGTDEAQEMKNAVSMVDFETFKAFDLGAPSEGDKGLAEGVRGGANPSSFIKSSTAGIQAYADAVEKKANTALRQAGIEPIRFTRRSDVPKSEPSLVEGLTKDLTAAQYDPYDPSDPSKLSLRLPPLPQQQELNKRIEEKMFQIASFAESGKDVDLARKSLAQIADKAVSPDIRALAQKYLDALPGRTERNEGAR